MKIYGKFSDPTNGPLNGLKHKLEYKHALDTIRLKNDDLYGGRFFFKTIFGKFLAISLCWTFSFHILNEIRHLIWDAGYGFDLKIEKITGLLALIGSFVFTILPPM